MVSHLVEKYYGVVSYGLLVAAFVGSYLGVPIAEKITTLHYYRESDGLYGVGPDDRYTMVGLFLVVVALRHTLSQYVMRPLAHICKIPAKSVSKFLDVGFFTVFHTLSFSFGYYLWTKDVSFPMKTELLYVSYPDNFLAWDKKAYYMFELGSWIACAFLLFVETRRKDHYQMLAHHVVTILLVYFSYYTMFTRAGHLIMIIMDFADIFLPMAKMFKYGGRHNMATALFAVFVVSWIYTRHYLMFLVWDSVPDHLIPVSRSIADPDTQFYATYRAVLNFYVLLALLQVLLYGWLWMILRMIWRLAVGEGISDVREDDDSDAEVGFTKNKDGKPLATKKKEE